MPGFLLLLVLTDPSDSFLFFHLLFQYTRLYKATSTSSVPTAPLPASHVNRPCLCAIVIMVKITQPSKYVESEVESSSISTTGIPLLLQLSAAQFLIKFDILRHLWLYFAIFSKLLKLRPVSYVEFSTTNIQFNCQIMRWKVDM